MSLRRAYHLISKSHDDFFHLFIQFKEAQVKCFGVEDEPVTKSIVIRIIPHLIDHDKHLFDRL